MYMYMHIHIYRYTRTHLHYIYIYIYRNTPTVRILQVVASISSATCNNIAEVAGALREEGQAPEVLEDITSEVVGPRVQRGPCLPKSEVSIYKGLLAKMNNGSKSLEDGSRVAVLAGKNSVVSDAILAGSIAAVYSSVSCQERWKRLQYQVLGAVWFRSELKAQDHLPDLRCLQPASEGQLLLLYRQQGGCILLSGAVASWCLWES